MNAHTVPRGHISTIVHTVHVQMAELVLRDEDDLPGLELELETTVAPVQPGCKCTGACKTARCPCKAMGYGCHSSRCKCKPAKVFHTNGGSSCSHGRHWRGNEQF